MEATSPVRRVLFISAGASHSVALLCKLLCFLCVIFSCCCLADQFLMDAGKQDFDEFIHWGSEKSVFK